MKQIDPALKREMRTPTAAIDQPDWCLRSPFKEGEKKQNKTKQNGTVSSNLFFLCLEGLENYHQIIITRYISKHWKMLWLCAIQKKRKEKGNWKADKKEKLRIEKRKPAVEQTREVENRRVNRGRKKRSKATSLSLKGVWSLEGLLSESRNEEWESCGNRVVEWN